MWNRIGQAKKEEHRAIRLTPQNPLFVQMTRDVVTPDIDLNREPSDRPVGSVLELGSLLHELETTHVQIEERIRLLEGVTARVRERQRCPQAQNLPETSNIPIEIVADVGIGIEMRNDEIDVAQQERSDERTTNCKMNSTYLVAKALEIDSVAKRVDGDGGNFFDCNVCLALARNPILTCCGHLFCWACYCQLPFADSSSKECPVCKGEVTDAGITPIYGNGTSSSLSAPESSSVLPPRPQAHRKESARQRRIARGVSHVPVAEALRRIRTGISEVGGPSQQQDPVSRTVSLNLPVQLRNSRRLPSQQFSGASSESYSSLSPISFALSNAERLAEDLEMYIYDHVVIRSQAQSPPVEVVDSFAGNSTALQSEHPVEEFMTDINSVVQHPSSSGRNDVYVAVVHSDNMISDASTDVSLTVPHPFSSSRRRSGLSRVPDIENGVLQGHRRRRLM